MITDAQLQQQMDSRANKQSPQISAHESDIHPQPLYLSQPSSYYQVGMNNQSRTVTTSINRPLYRTQATTGYQCSENPQQENRHSPCTICGQRAPMETVRQVSTTQWVWCFVTCLFFLPLSCVPFCCSKCDDIKYVCSICKGVRAYYKAPLCP